MDPTLLVAGFVAPALFWIGYLYYKDRHRPEPFAAKGLAFLLGIGSGWLCLHAYSLVPLLGLPADPWALNEQSRLGFLAYSVGVTGVLEEGAKFLPFWLICTRLRWFDEKLDGFVYASCVALGFATYENLFYLPVLDGFERYGRAIAAPLIHTMFASIWGHAYARAHLQGGSPLAPTLVALAIAAALHGLYNFFTIDTQLRLGSALIVLAIWTWRTRWIRRYQRKERQRASELAGGPPGGPPDGVDEGRQAGGAAAEAET